MGSKAYYLHNICFMTKRLILRFLLFFMLAIVEMPLWAFDGGLFRLHGVVVESLSGEGIPGVAIVCKRTGQGVVSNEHGEFALDVSWSDSLIFQAIAYDNLTVKPPDSLFGQSILYVVEMKPAQHQLDAVNVTGEERGPLALRSEVFKEKPKAADFFFRPISVLYYYASKRERRKRYLTQLIEQEKLMDYYAHVYNSDVIAKYSGLESRDLDYCIIYCNSHIILEEGDTDEVVKWKTMNVISDYYKQKKID